MVAMEGVERSKIDDCLIRTRHFQFTGIDQMFEGKVSPFLLEKPSDELLERLLRSRQRRVFETQIEVHRVIDLVQFDSWMRLIWIVILGEVHQWVAKETYRIDQVDLL